MNLLQRRNLGVFCLLGLALTVSAQAQRYSVGTPIGTPYIVLPATGSSIPTGETVTLKCRPVTDYDYDNYTCSMVYDGATITWTAKDAYDNDVGTFLDNQGTTAVWIAPTAEGEVTVYATADDDPDYLADDPPRQHSVVLVIEKIFRFTAWADNRPSLGSTTQERFHWVVLEMNRILCPSTNPYQWPEFHVVPGDYDHTSQTEAELDDYSSFPDWSRAPGNHDDDIGSLSNSSVDYKNARFIYLNEYVCPAGTHNNSQGRVCSHILSWLDGQLTDAPPFVFVVGHEPAFPQNRHVGDSLDLYPDDRDAFWSLINSHGVYAYLCGHTHYYSTYSDATGDTVQIDLGNAANSPESQQTFVVFEVRDTDVTRHTYRGVLDQPFEEY